MQHLCKMTTTRGLTFLSQKECFVHKPVGLNSRQVSLKPESFVRNTRARCLRPDWRLKNSSVRDQVPVMDSENTVERFDWYQYWWPVQLTSNLKTDRPNTVELLDRTFVVWKGPSGNWIVLKDECPHRLAPLSEGKTAVCPGDWPLHRTSGRWRNFAVFVPCLEVQWMWKVRSDTSGRRRAVQSNSLPQSTIFSKTLSLQSNLHQ